MIEQKISRRDFLRTTVFATGAIALAACQPAVPGAAPVEKVLEAEKAIPTAASTGCIPDWNQRLPPVPKKYSPPVQIAVTFSDISYIEGMSATNNPWYNWIKENMGIEFTVHWVADGDIATQKLQTDIAAGTLPDFFSAEGALLAQLIDSGAVEEIRDLYENTTTPLVKEQVGYPDGSWWKQAFRGEKLYGCSHSLTKNALTGIGWIRKDLLDELGLDVPDSLDGLENAMRQMLDAKLCKYGVGTGKEFSWHHLDQVYGAYGVMPGTWRDQGGSLVYDSTSPGIKDALERLSNWYKTGILNPDFFTLEYDQVKGETDRGDVAWFARPMWGTPLPTMTTTDGKTLKWARTDVFTGPTGQKARKGTNPLFHAWVFRKGLEPTKIEALLNQLNYYMDLEVNGPEQYDNYGPLWGITDMFLEGVDWVWTEDCEVKQAKESTVATGLTSTGGMFRDVGFWHSTFPNYQFNTDKYLLKLASQDPATLNKAQKVFLENPTPLAAANAYNYVMTTPELDILDEYMGIPTERMATLVPELKKMEDELFIGIITSQKDLAEFDSFKDDWLANGGDQVTADVNAWYATVK